MSAILIEREGSIDKTKSATSNQAHYRTLIARYTPPYRTTMHVHGTEIVNARACAAVSLEFKDIDEALASRHCTSQDLQTMASCLRQLDFEDSTTKNLCACWEMSAKNLATTTASVLNVVLRHVPSMDTGAAGRTCLLPDAVVFFQSIALLLAISLRYPPFASAAAPDEAFCADMVTLHILLYCDEGTSNATLTQMGDSMDTVMQNGGRRLTMREMVKLSEAKVDAAMGTVYASLGTQTIHGQFWDRFRFAGVILQAYHVTRTKLLPSMREGWPQVLSYMRLAYAGGPADRNCIIRRSTRGACVRVLAHLIENSRTVLLGVLGDDMCSSLWDLVLNYDDPGNYAALVLRFMRMQSIHVQIIIPLYHCMTEANENYRLSDEVDKFIPFRDDWDATYEIVKQRRRFYKEEMYTKCGNDQVRVTPNMSVSD